MPRDKDLKRLVRSRMKKTGESYTTARSHLLDKQQALPTNYAELAGYSDNTVNEKTGRSWKQWVRLLDTWRATEWKHTEIVRQVTKQGVSGWWAQTVTIGYERIRGLREIGQRLDGQYEAGKSRTFPASVDRVYRAFAHKRMRDRWLADIDLTIRTAQVNKTLRVSWPDGTAVDVYFVPKGAAKTQVAIQHRKLKNKSAVTKQKAFWHDRLDALGTILSG